MKNKLIKLLGGYTKDEYDSETSHLIRHMAELRNRLKKLNEFLTRKGIRH